MTLKELKQTYWMNKSILNIIQDPEHEDHLKVLRSVSVKEVEKIVSIVRELEDMGIQLITRPIN